MFRPWIYLPSLGCRSVGEDCTAGSEKNLDYAGVRKGYAARKEVLWIVPFAVEKLKKERWRRCMRFQSTDSNKGEGKDFTSPKPGIAGAWAGVAILLSCKSPARSSNKISHGVLQASTEKICKI